MILPLENDRGVDMNRFAKGQTLLASLLVATALGGAANAQDAAQSANPTTNPPKSNGSNIAEVVVTAGRVRSLEQFTPTGSRLNVSPRDTPATLDLITTDTMTTRGFLTAEQAADSLPGVTSGATPGDLSDFHIRGFSDTQVSQLHNGLYIGPSDMVARPQNTFNIQSVEVLKGPASVLYGQGAIGGAVNIVNKAPQFGALHGEATAAYGTFGTAAIGVGATGSLTNDVAGRADVSWTSSNGYVQRTPSDSFNATVSLLWRATPKLDIQLLVDYLSDHPSSYWGTPLVPYGFAADPLKGVISTNFGYTLDKRTQDVNYNVADYGIESHQVWPQLFVKYQVSDDIQFNNFFYVLDAHRRWKDSETYIFDPSTNLISRDRFFVDHDQTLIGEQADLTFSQPLFGLQNKLNIGVDYSHLDFHRKRGFPDGDEVDPFNPDPGLFGSRAGALTAPTQWDDPAVFFEDILSLTKDLKLVTGFRYDYLYLNRENFDANGVFVPSQSFRRIFHPATYRVGLVYDVNQYVTPYISYTTGEDPVGSDIFTVNAGTNFDLGHSDQIEAGVKASAPGNRAAVTLSIFSIHRANVLTENGLDNSVPVGSETSKGVELSGDVRVTDQWTINANVSYNEAKYGTFKFTDAVTGADVIANGNYLPGAPKWVSNVWTSYTKAFGLPLELGAGVKYVGTNYGDYGNTELLNAYTTLNLYATYSLTPKVDLSLRVDNVTDKAYGVVDVNYERQVILGRPRYYQFDVRVRF
jgi:iron complex outermembrane receptor protein